MALAVLRDREEWASNLAPDAPSLSSDELHPSIWGAAAPIWPTAEYKLAAGSACTSLSAHIKSKAHSHLNDRELAAQVFKPIRRRRLRRDCTFQAIPRTRTGSPSSRAFISWLGAPSPESATSQFTTRSCGPSTRHWNTWRCYPWSRGGPTRLSFCRRDGSSPPVRALPPWLTTWVTNGPRQGGYHTHQLLQAT